MMDKEAMKHKAHRAGEILHDITEELYAEIAEALKNNPTMHDLKDMACALDHVTHSKKNLVSIYHMLAQM